MHALGGARLEAAELLELAACPGLEATELRRDAVLDGSVVADVEVEVAERAYRAPVATVERVALLHVERAGDHLASLARHDQAEPVAQALSGQLEEAVVEVLLPPGEALDGRLVELEHPRHERRRDVAARVHRDLHAVRRERAALAARLVATLAAQAREVLVERGEAGVRPVILVARALQPAAGTQHGRLVGQAEVHVDRRETVPAAPLFERRGERGDDLAPRGPHGEEARPGDRREGYAHQELRVVGDPRPSRGCGPALIEDELPEAVALHIEGTGPHELAVLPERQVLGQPARRGRRAPRVLDGGEPLPLEEG